MIDARRQEVYTATFDKNGNKISKTEALIIDKQSFEKELAGNSVYFFGNGSDKCQVLIDHPNAVFINGIHPSAAAMGEMSYLLYNAKKFEDVAYFEPFYLKDFVATTPKNKVL
jgi:tRNA threonylcarbamoyladenosine biosynthesis protein TsaB